MEKLEADHERAVLTASPYGDDPELAWTAPVTPLRYDGEIPAEVLALAKARRER